MQVLVILVPSSKTLEPAALNAIAAAKLLGSPVTVLIAGIYQHRLTKHLKTSTLVEQIDVAFEEIDDFDALTEVLYQHIKTRYSNYHAIFFTKNDFGDKFKLLMQGFPYLTDVNYAQNLTEEQHAKIVKDAFDLKTQLIPPAKMPTDFIAPEVHTDDSEQAGSPEFQTLLKDMSPKHIRKVKKRALSEPLPTIMTLPRSESELSDSMDSFDSSDLPDCLNSERKKIDIESASEETESESEEPKKPKKHKRWRKIQTYFSTKITKLKSKPENEKNSIPEIKRIDSDQSRLRSESVGSKEDDIRVFIWNTQRAAVETKKLGAGEFGSVVKTMAVDLKTKKVIPESRAVKTLTSSPSSAVAKRSSDEYRISAALFGSYGSMRNPLGHTSIFDMPYHEGIDLFSLILKFYETNEPAYDFKFRIKLIIEICAALAKLHAKGVVHKDLKPENMIFNPETTQIKICDLGFAITENSSNTDRSGSPEFVSPEVLWREDKPATPASDMFAIGIIITMILGGQGTTNLLWSKAQQGIASWNERTIRNNLRWVREYLNKESAEHAEIIIDQIISLLEFYPQDRPTANDCGEFFTEIYNEICLPEERKTFNENPKRRSSLGFYGFVPKDSMRESFRAVDSANIADTLTINSSSIKSAFF